MFLDKDFCTVNQVWRNLATFNQSEFSLQVFAFAFLYAVETYVCDTRTLFQLDVQVYLVAFYLIGRDFYVGKQSMPPVFFTAPVMSSPGTVMVCPTARPEIPTST